MDDIDTSQYYVIRKGEYDDMKAEIERLRAAGDALAKQVTKPCRCVEAHDGAINETCAPCAAFFDWEDARRGWTES